MPFGFICFKNYISQMEFIIVCTLPKAFTEDKLFNRLRAINVYPSLGASTEKNHTF